MARSKRVFLIFTVVFLAILFYASYDIARRTTFPGAKAQLQERIKNKMRKDLKDSVTVDSLSPRKPLVE